MAHTRDNTPWWASESPHTQLAATIKALDEEQANQHEQDLRHLRFYSNRAASGLTGADWSQFSVSQHLKMNLAKAVVNTATAWTATNKTRTMFLTRKGSRRKRIEGERLGRFTLALRRRQRVHEKGLLAFRDAGVFGDGYLFAAPKFTRTRKGKLENGKILIERALPRDVIVDDQECRYGNPWSMIYVKDVDKEALADEFPNKKLEIESAGCVRDSQATGVRNLKGTVALIRAWRLPTHKSKGKYIECTDNATLYETEWEYDRFPFAKFSWDSPIIGYRGIGMIEEISPIQREINYILQKIQRLMTLATSQIWVEKGSQVNTRALNNQDWAAREYRGRPPIFMTVQSVSPEYFNQLDRLWNRGFETVGVAQMSATGEKPAGLNSGKAVRTYRDVTTRRFLHTQQHWESFHTDDVDQLLIDAATTIKEVQGHYKVTAVDGRSIEEIDFSDIDLDRDQYLMQPYPVSFLPDEPAGQMETLKEFGEVNPEIQRRLIETMHYPDLEEAVARATIQERTVELLIDQMIDEARYRPPDPFIDPSVSVPLVRYAILQAETEGVPDDRVDLLRNFLTETQRLWAPPAPVTPVGPPGVSPAPAPAPAPAPPAA